MQTQATDTSIAFVFTPAEARAILDRSVYGTLNAEQLAFYAALRHFVYGDEEEEQ